MNNLTPEMIEKAKEAKSADELKTFAKANNVELTDEEAIAYFNQLCPKIGELDDDELDNIAGGGCGKSNNNQNQSSAGERPTSWSGRCPNCKGVYYICSGMSNKPTEKPICRHCVDRSLGVFYCEIIPVYCD